jgi:hypothetical protein
MSALSDWLTRLSLSDIASVASIAGLLITIWVAANLRKIKTFYLFTARVPQLARRLRQHSSALATYMNDPVSFQEKIREEMVAAEVTVDSLQRKLGGHSKKTVRNLLTNVRRASEGEFSPPAIREVYLLMIHVNEQLKDLQSDLKWEK